MLGIDTGIPKGVPASGDVVSPGALPRSRRRPKRPLYALRDEIKTIGTRNEAVFLRAELERERARHATEIAAERALRQQIVEALRYFDSVRHLAASALGAWGFVKKLAGI